MGKRSRDEFDRGDEHAERAAIFGIQQGALDKGDAARIGRALIEIGFDGYAMGGLAVGEGQEAMLGCLDFAVEHASGRPTTLFDGCRQAGRYRRGGGARDRHVRLRASYAIRRTGQAFTADGPLNMRNARFAEDQEPIEPGCQCPACTKFSRAYVHHLVKSGEILGAMLMTQHNLWFYQRVMRSLREAIAAQRLHAFASEFLKRYRGR